KAAASADQAASDAATSAVDAAGSAQWAQASATAAYTAGAQARASEIAAGKDSKAADQAFADAFQTAVQKKEAERKAAEKDTGAQAEARYRCGMLGCDAVERPGRYCQHNEVLCGLASMGPGAEVAAEELWTVEKDFGLGNWYPCSKGDLDACVQIAEDQAFRSKWKLLEEGVEALQDLRRLRYMKGCTQCFPAGTKILMANAGTENIETIHPGDTVLATDPITGRTAPRKVSRLIITDGDKHFDELTITTPDGPRKLTATYEHPFWSPSAHQWVKAHDLTPGTTLLSTGGTTVRVQANRAFDQRTRTYNLTVDDLHTYYVLAGATPVLVHNSSSCSIKDVWHPGSFKTPEESFEWHYAERHGARAGVTREQYLQDAKDWVERLAQPGGKIGLNAKRVPIGDNGEFGVKYVDPQTGMGGILGPDGKVVSFWYSAEGDR
ncbi:polymorphic toxin-type HINT domain-containing protein, partial [Streptomyces sp. NPDC003233]